jgi:hypothetical protein
MTIGWARCGVRHVGRASTVTQPGRLRVLTEDDAGPLDLKMADVARFRPIVLGDVRGRCKRTQGAPR